MDIRWLGFDEALWETLDATEVTRIEAAWAASCARPVAAFTGSDAAREELERRWAILHPPIAEEATDVSA